MDVVYNLFGAIADMLPEAVSLANAQIAEKAVDNIKGHIIVNNQIDTGGMLNSVHAEPKSDGSQDVVVDCKNEAGEYYAAYPNYGTVHQPPNPFFEPGLQDTQPDIDAALAGIVAKMAQIGR